MPRAIARITSRPSRSSTVATATSPVRSRRQEQAHGSRVEERRERETDHGQQRHDARGQPCLRCERADLGIDAAPLIEPAGERAKERGQVATGTQLQRDSRCREAGAPTERRRQGRGDVVAGRGATNRQRERLAGGSARGGSRDERAIRGAPGSQLGCDPAQRIGQVPLQRALGARRADAL